MVIWPSQDTCFLNIIIIRLITEVKEWCSVITQMVDDAGKKLVEEVMSSANPALLKFVKNENICSLLNQANIGFLTTVPTSSVSVQSMKKELTTKPNGK